MVADVPREKHECLYCWALRADAKNYSLDAYVREAASSRTGYSFKWWMELCADHEAEAAAALLRMDTA